MVARFAKFRKGVCENLQSGQMYLTGNRNGMLTHTRSEVRKGERRRKKAGPLGSGGPQASGDPVRPYGEPGAQLNGAKNRTEVTLGPACAWWESPLGFSTRFCRPLQRTEGPPLANPPHVCGLRGIFVHVHAAAENDSDPVFRLREKFCEAVLQMENRTEVTFGPVSLFSFSN